LGSKRIKVLSTLSPTAPITNTRFNSLLAPVAVIMKKTIDYIKSFKEKYDDALRKYASKFSLGISVKNILNSYGSIMLEL
jgi:hypothetical protein